MALVGVRMPGPNGIILHQLIQENYPDVAVVFITGVDSVDTAVGLLKCGAFDYLVKPVTLVRLHQVVEEALYRRNSSLEQSEALAVVEDEILNQARNLAEGMRELSRHLQPS